jgi:hypothetical protein
MDCFISERSILGSEAESSLRLSHQTASAQMFECRAGRILVDPQAGSDGRAIPCLVGILDEEEQALELLVRSDVFEEKRAQGVGKEIGLHGRHPNLEGSQNVV